MAITRDTSASNFNDTNPQVFSHATGNSPRGVVVILGHDTTTDRVTGVTYGGAALTRVVRVATATAGSIYLYFLGSSVPTGAQNVSVSKNASQGMFVVSHTFLGAADLEVVDSDSLSATQTDPQLTLQYGGRSCLTALGLFGADGETSVWTLVSGLTALAAWDWGTTNSKHAVQTNATTADSTVGYTAASRAVALAALAIGEVVAGGGTPLDVVLLNRTQGSRAE